MLVLFYNSQYNSINTGFVATTVDKNKQRCRVSCFIQHGHLCWSYSYSDRESFR